MGGLAQEAPASRTTSIAANGPRLDTFNLPHVASKRADLRVSLRWLWPGFRGQAAYHRGCPDDVRCLRRPYPAAALARSVHPEGRRMVRHRLPLGSAQEGDLVREGEQREGEQRKDDHRQA